MGGISSLKAFPPLPLNVAKLQCRMGDAKGIVVNTRADSEGLVFSAHPNPIRQTIATYYLPSSSLIKVALSVESESEVGKISGLKAFPSCHTFNVTKNNIITHTTKNATHITPRQDKG